MRSELPDPARQPCALCLDFDGTVTTQDVLLTLIRAHARPGWRAFEERWRRGEITSLECMEGLLALVEQPLRRLRELARHVPLDPAFPQLVRRARGAGFHVEIVSDGLDVYIHPVLARAGLADLPFTANRALDGPAGAVSLRPPHAAEHRDEAGNYKAHHLGLLGRRFRHLTFVGDGLSDRGAARVADLVFAKGELAAHCRAAGLAHVPFEGLSDLLEEGALAIGAERPR